MPFAIVSRLIEEYNTAGITSVLRADNILDVQLSSTPGTTFALSDYQKKSFKENGILPLKIGNGTILAYRDTGNAWKVAYGTEQSDISVMEAQSRLKREYPDFDFSGGVSKISLADAMKDSKFKTPYTTASKTWRGGNAGWYDELASLGENIHGYTRSRWFKFASKSVTSGVKNVFNSLAKSSLSRGGSNTSITRGNGSYETGGTHTNEDGIEIPDIETENYDANEGSLIGRDKTTANTQVAAKFISMASSASEVICAGVEGLMGVQTLVSTYQRVQKLNLISGYMEAVQSVQAGSAESDPMHEYNNRLTTNNPETGKNAMSSAGIGALFNGANIDANDASVQSVNTEKTLANVANSTDGGIMGVFGGLVGDANKILAAYQRCNYLQGGLAIASAVVTVLSVIPIIGQGIAAINLTVKTAVKAAVKTAITVAAPIIAREVVKYAGNLLIKDIATDWLGEDLGNALVSGGNSLLSANHQIGGGSPGSSAEVGVFKRGQAQVIAEEAEYQRSIRSPFDTSSQYTFLGSIIHNLIPMANSSGVGSMLKNISSIMTNSVSNLLPTASAIAETNMVGIAKPGDCPNLEVIGIQGDVYCNPLYISDQDSMGSDYTPEEIISQEIRWGYITRDGSGNLAIKPNTNLTNYINYCGQRNSSWGIADANIANQIVQGGSSVGKSIAGFIPIVGDIISVIDAANKEANLPWTTGSACVASESNEYWCENRIHQRFIEDQRFFENAGNTNNNLVVAYLNDYYESHPLDQSFEGVLARYSGITKDDVIATLDFIDGLTYIANYHPEERYAFGYEAEETDLQIEPSREILIATEPKYIIYNALRNRSNAIL